MTKSNEPNSPAAYMYMDNKVSTQLAHALVGPVFVVGWLVTSVFLVASGLLS
ncbi:MAG: hypothetical protein GY913_15980 [Proteobacteria bacterium]|nr:hypothetical protein [Pseudomonadota bacterium]MCP4918404.1 hypothetical protein [Pseudomonadota bacterium]